MNDFEKIKKTKGYKKWYGAEERDLDELRFEIVKSMLNAFPKLRTRVKKYLDST